MRSGEKLYEELLIDKDVTHTEHSKIKVANETFLQWKKLEPSIQQLNEALACNDLVSLRKILSKTVTGYVN